MSRPLLCLAGLIGFLLLSPAVSSAQPLFEDGRPLLRKFSPKDYRSHYQTWSATQASDGRMWFGTLNGAVIFDGHTWTKADVPTSFVRQVVEGPRGRMFVGGEDVLGYVEPAPTGGWRFVSLLDRIPAEAKPVGLSRRVVRLGDDIFIGGDRQLFRVRGDDVRSWSFDPARRNSVDVVNGEVFLMREGEGILRLQGDDWKPWVTPPGMERRQFTFLLPADGAVALLALGNDGLFRLDADGKATRWGEAARTLAGGAPFFGGRRLRDGSYAFGTVNAGMILLSADGATARQIAVADGLSANVVLGVGEDREGGLWAATQNGITRFDRTTPATVFDQTNGLGEALTQSLVRHGETLYTVFGSRVHRLIPSAQLGRARWEPETAIPEKSKVNAIASHPSGLIIGDGTGVHLLAGDKLTGIVESPIAITTFAKSVTDPDRIFLGWGNSVSAIRYTGGRWVNEGTLSGLEGAPFSMVEEADGTLWVATDTRGVLRARRPAGSAPTAPWSAPVIKTFHEKDGTLPAGHGWVFVEQTPLGVRFATEQGPALYDRGTDRLILDSALIAAGGKLPLFEAFTRGVTGDTWSMNASSRTSPERPLVRIRASAGGGLTVTDAPAAIGSLLGLSGLQLSLYESRPSGDVLWARGLENLVRIELSRLASTDFSAAPLLTEFSAEGRTVPMPAAPGDTVPLQFSTEPLVFRFASTRYGGGSTPRFQTRLVGFRDTWSAPAAGTEAVFTNLVGGPFRFEVRTLDADGHTGPVASLAFTVAPPWARSPAAFALYGLAALSAMFGFVRWRLGRAERERLRLEALVTQRTAELAVATAKAETANQAKSAFLANMSHELRTPLNGVIGYAQVLMKDRDLSQKNRDRLQVVQTSGEHLLRMINEVLDFSKIEAGRMELRPAPFHLPQLLRDIAAALSPRAELKELEFVFDFAADLPELVIGDALKLRQILDNLLSNAVKFTTTGSVTLRVGRIVSAPASGPESAGAEATQLIEFTVQDTGVGIAESDLPALFQPFHQAADGRPPEPGTGLGLAISQRFVTLMNSTLKVSSRRGVGTTFSFSVSLPVLAVQADAPGDSPRAITGYTGAPRHVMIVDDVAINRHVLRELLAPLGFHLTEAADGPTALALAATTPPDLVFLDLRMPGMDGFELAKRLRTLPAGARTKLIAMSASVLSFNRDDAFAAGCDDFLPKPFREADLLSRIRLALRLEWESAAETATSAQNSATPFPAAPTRLSSSDLSDLLTLARRGEIVALRRKLAGFHSNPGPVDPLVATLESLAKSYRMERIRELLERAHLAPPSPP